MKTSKYILLVSIVLVQCLMAKPNIETVREQIKKMHQERIDTALKGDYSKTLSIYAKDALIMPSFKTPVKGIKGIEKMYAEDRKHGVKHQTISYNTTDDWMCGDDYYMRGTWAMSFTSEYNDRPVAYYGSFFEIWGKQKDGSYKVEFNIWNLDHPPL